MQTEIIKITVPVSPRIYEAFIADMSDQLHDPHCTVEERDWWTKLAAKMNRRLRHLNGEKRAYNKRAAK